MVQRTFNEWKTCPYDEWLKSGGCSIGEVNEMLAQDHFHVTLGELKSKTLGELFGVPGHGIAYEAICENFYVDNARDFSK